MTTENERDKKFTGFRYLLDASPDAYRGKRQYIVRYVDGHPGKRNPDGSFIKTPDGRKTLSWDVVAEEPAHPTLYPNEVITALDDNPSWVEREKYRTLSEVHNKTAVTRRKKAKEQPHISDLVAWFPTTLFQIFLDGEAEAKNLLQHNVVIEARWREIEGPKVDAKGNPRPHKNGKPLPLYELTYGLTAESLRELEAQNKETEAHNEQQTDPAKCYDIWQIGSLKKGISFRHDFHIKRPDADSAEMYFLGEHELKKLWFGPEKKSWTKSDDFVGILQDRGSDHGQAHVARDKYPDPERTNQRNTNKIANPESAKNQVVKASGADDKKFEDFINNFCRNVTAEAENGQLESVVGREEETQRLLQLLLRPKKSGTCITGDGGVGKTALVNGLGRRLLDKKTLPSELHDVLLLELDISALVSGTKYRGELEERLRALKDRALKYKGRYKGQKVIYFIDELPTLVGAGASDEGGGIAQLLKPLLARKFFPVIGATTEAEYQKHILKDSALSRRFRELSLKSLNREGTINALKTAWKEIREEMTFTKDPSEADFAYLADLSIKHTRFKAQPDAAIDLLGEAASSARLALRTEITHDDIGNALSSATNKPKEFLLGDMNERLRGLRAKMKDRVYGQPALDKICDAVIKGALDLVHPNKPRGAHLFVGPTGVGKTETAKVIAEEYYGSDKSIIRIDMADYKETNSIAKLLGSPPGYVGYREKAIFDKVRDDPNVVLLFDEIEKGHPEVMDALLAILDNGEWVNPAGQKIDFRSTTIILTSNRGAEEAKKYLDIIGKRRTGKVVKEDMKVGIAGAFEDEVKKDWPKTDAEWDAKIMKDLEVTYKEALTKDRPATSEHPGRAAFIRPEFFARLRGSNGNIWVFIPLKKEEQLMIVSDELEHAEKQFSANRGSVLSGVRLDATQEVREKIAEDGYSDNQGARGINGIVNDKILTPISRWILENEKEIRAELARNPKSKILVDSYDDFKPKLVPDLGAPANDAATPAKQQRQLANSR